MRIKGKKIKISQFVCLVLYYSVGVYLPKSQSFFHIGCYVRRFLCKHIFKKCGKNVNVEKGAWFGSGYEIELGDFSGIGINAHIPNNTIIGNYVMMGPNCYILDANHSFDDLSNPMMFQGRKPVQQTVIGNDVWIGRDVLMTPGRTIKDGSIIAARCVLTKDFPEYSIVGGNPGRLLKQRK